MPHVTFIHGLANKPPHEKLHQIWLRALQKGDGGLDLEGEGVTTRMIYYGDVLYENPEEDDAAEESFEEKSAEQVDGSGDAETPAPQNAEEAAFLAAFRARLTQLPDAAIESGAADLAPPPPAATQLERVPLPWFVKKRIMKAMLRDAYLFLFNKDFSPRAGASFKVQDTLRQRFVEALRAAPAGEKHVVVSHSMGTLVAYDCLKRVADCPRVDGFVTFGSPLGIDEVQDRFHPEWTRHDGYLLEERIGAPWINFYDPLDVVCGADPKLANDFRRAGQPLIEDREVRNEGSWRHSVVKYLARREMREGLARLLEL